MDDATRQRLYEPTAALIECLFTVKDHFGLTHDDGIRMLATVVGAMNSDQCDAFQVALADVRNDMVTENVFERAKVWIAVKQAADAEYKQ